MKYKVGQLVLNRKLGIGKVLEVSGNEVMAFFKNEQMNPRTIDVSIVPMEIPAEQSDPFFDDMGVREIAKMRKPSKAKTSKPRVTKAAKAAAAVEAAARE